jgi:hypothetical protein
LEEFGGEPGEPISLTLRTMSTEELMGEHEVLESRMRSMGAYESRDRVVFFAIEDELERRGLRVKSQDKD